MTMPMAVAAASRAVIALPPARRAAPMIAAMALVLALMGPFGTQFTMPLITRAGYWLVTNSLIGGMTVLAFWAARRRFAKGVPLWFVALAPAAMAAPGLFIVEACLRLWTLAALAHVSRFDLLGQVLLTNEVLTFVSIAVLRFASATPRLAGPSAPVGNPLAQRLPPALCAGRVIALQAEDHYLRVHTDRGAALIHMRIADAESLLSRADGLRVHRSYWVAREALVGAERRAGQWRLRLENGLIAPVSRSRIAAVRDAGWLG